VKRLQTTLSAVATSSDEEKAADALVPTRAKRKQRAEQLARCAMDDERYLIRNPKLVDAAITALEDAVFHVEKQNRFRPTGADEQPQETPDASTPGTVNVGGEGGEGESEPCTEFQRGLLTGKLSALRWVMGEPWDAPA